MFLATPIRDEANKERFTSELQRYPPFYTVSRAKATFFTGCNRFFRLKAPERPYLLRQHTLYSSRIIKIQFLFSIQNPTRYSTIMSPTIMPPLRGSDVLSSNLFYFGLINRSLRLRSCNPQRAGALSLSTLVQQMPLDRKCNSMIIIKL